MPSALEVESIQIENDFSTQVSSVSHQRHEAIERILLKRRKAIRNWEDTLDAHKTKNTANKYKNVLLAFFKKYPLKHHQEELYDDSRLPLLYWDDKLADQKVGKSYQKVIKAALSWLNVSFKLKWDMKEFTLKAKKDRDGSNAHQSLPYGKCVKYRDAPFAEDWENELAFKIQYRLAARV